MKIAIPTNDNETIFGHFGRTQGFRIVEIEKNKVIDSQYLTNDFTGHAQGHHHHDHQHNHAHQAHSHAGIFNAIGDCEIVIANGMGRRLYDDFQRTNTKVFITRETNIERAVNAFLNDELDNNESQCCSH